MTSKRELHKKNPNSADRMAAHSPVMHEDIAQRAFEIHMRCGADHGNDLRDWLQAESELREEQEKNRD